MKPPPCPTADSLDPAYVLVSLDIELIVTFGE